LDLCLVSLSSCSGLAVEPNHAAVGGPPRDSVFQLAEQAGSDEGSSSDIRRTITMYREGFVIDDGPYRRLDDPANADFLRALAMGRTPAELMEGDDGNVTVGLVDKRQEDFVETFRSFSGAGATLGAISAVTGSTVDSRSLPDAQALDESRPSTSIQVRLPNGKREVLKVNLDVPVLQLASQVAQLLGDQAGSFQLVAGFPPKPLVDFESSVEAAGLKGAQVQVKKV
jgi:UBX domain-containing protein 1